MADVVVGVTERLGVVAVIMFWSTDEEPCDAPSPSGLRCMYPEGHDGDWHIGFPDNEPGLMPVKWKDDFVV